MFVIILMTGGDADVTGIKKHDNHCCPSRRLGIYLGSLLSAYALKVTNELARVNKLLVCTSMTGSYLKRRVRLYIPGTCLLLRVVLS